MFRQEIARWHMQPSPEMRNAFSERQEHWRHSHRRGISGAICLLREEVPSDAGLAARP